MERMERVKEEEDAAAGAAVSSGGITRSALPAGDACVEEV